jgi:hypothetical protein
MLQTRGLVSEPRASASGFRYFSAACEAAKSNWKGVRHGFKGPIELYDLVRDAGESKDVAAAHPDVAKMDTYLQSQHTDSPEYPVDAGERNS